MPSNRLSGHTLRQEGRAFAKDRITGGWFLLMLSSLGVGLCSCGDTSEELDSNAARKAWHRAHKDQIRAKMAAPEVSG